MTPTKHLLHIAAVAAVATTGVARAATYDQTTFAPATTDWNGPAIWGNNDVTPGNDYQMGPDPARIASNTPIETTFTISFGGVTTPWPVYGQVRDHGGTGLPTTNSTFNGDHLLIAGQTRFISKARNTTSTANFVLQDGGMMFLTPGGSSADGPGTGTWDGTIVTSGTTLIGLEATANTNITTLDIVAPISGSGTLILTGKGGQTGFLNLKGDLSGFTGTFLLTPAVGKSGTPLVFSITSDASFATLQLDIESPLFLYDLGDGAVSFGSLIVGETTLGAGTYDADWLNANFGDGSQFMGGGSITVVPEPQTIALLTAALLAGVAFRRRPAA